MTARKDDCRPNPDPIPTQIQQPLVRLLPQSALSTALTPERKGSWPVDTMTRTARQYRTAFGASPQRHNFPPAAPPRQFTWDAAGTQDTSRLILTRCSAQPSPIFISHLMTDPPFIRDSRDGAQDPVRPRAKISTHNSVETNVERARRLLPKVVLSGCEIRSFRVKCTSFPLNVSTYCHQYSGCNSRNLSISSIRRVRGSGPPMPAYMIFIVLQSGRLHHAQRDVERNFAVRCSLFSSLSR